MQAFLLSRGQMASMEATQESLQEHVENITQPKRVQCFIDGYNLFHAIDETGNKSLHWVDLKSLCQRYLPKNARIENVFWFSAKPSHLSKNINDNYDNYVNALIECGVDVIGGRFKRKNAKCEVDKGCRGAFFKHEEKESDVNLAIGLVANACNDDFDIAIVITADSDLCPPIKYVKDNFPDKELWLIAPPGRRNRANDLCVLSSKSLEINSNALRASSMRETYSKAGSVVARRPAEWQFVANQGRTRRTSR